jgi:hypothetical protein
VVRFTILKRKDIIFYSFTFMSHIFMPWHDVYCQAVVKKGICQKCDVQCFWYLQSYKNNEEPIQNLLLKLKTDIIIKSIPKMWQCTAVIISPVCDIGEAQDNCLIHTAVSYLQHEGHTTCRCRDQHHYCSVFEEEDKATFCIPSCFKLVIIPLEFF